MQVENSMTCRKIVEMSESSVQLSKENRRLLVHSLHPSPFYSNCLGTFYNVVQHSRQIHYTNVNSQRLSSNFFPKHGSIFIPKTNMESEQMVFLFFSRVRGWWLGNKEFSFLFKFSWLVTQIPLLHGSIYCANNTIYKVIADNSMAS